MNPPSHRCFLVEKNAERAEGRVKVLREADLPDGEVTVAILYSAVNYKDALAATGHPGVALQLPLIPGIDAVGTVIESTSPARKPGDQILIKSADFGTRVHGGWSSLARVPAAWCYSIPKGLSPLQAAGLGTAGFTAAQCVDQLIRHNVHPDSGPVVVSGATGGVGICAVMILAKLGYDVVASTGKADRTAWLLEQGACEVIPRTELSDTSGKPLLSARWAGGVDTAGGNTLATMLRQTRNRGCVAACGLVDSPALNLTVYPFILRGATLQGIDSANLPRIDAERIWNLLGESLKIDQPERICRILPLEQVDTAVKSILAGEVAGRIVVDCAPGSAGN